MARISKGFTIIELVVVIVILGILAAVAFPRFNDLSDNARAAVVQGGVAAFKSAAIIAYAKNNGLPVTGAAVAAQTSAENVTFTTTCPTITATYNATTISSTFTLDSTICNL